MPLTLENHLAFWRTVAKDLSRGKPLLATLGHVKAKLAKTDLARVAEHLIQDISAGSCLSDAMAPHQAAFSRCVCAMVRAAEAGGVLDVIAGRIAEGLQDSSFPLPGDAAREDDLVRYWRAFGRLLSSGVPILEALGLISTEAAGPKLAEATQAIRQAILNGENMAAAMRELPDAFPDEVSLAISIGEEEGNLDEQALRIADALEAGDTAALRSGIKSLDELDAEGEKGTVVKCVNLTIIEAIGQRASDIHLDPTEDGRGRIRQRVDGVLHDIEPPPEKLFAKIVSRIKIMACMDIAEKRLPQDGRIKLNIKGKPYDLRVSSVPTVHGERIVMRILDRESVRLDLERIGFPDDELATVRELCHLPNGIIICNGPTGSGKTTLLYSMLHEIDRDKCCVMSVEDPVEYHIEGVAQTQVEAKKGLTFARAVRSFLRQDPDVIMVGEIRDLETAQICVQCALTGHLVLTTLHANTSPGAIKRLLDVGLEPFLVNGSLSAVISQRLVRMLCPECKRETEPPPHSMPPEAVEFIQKLGEATFYAPKGCDACNGTGHRGRTAIHEILIPGDRVRQVIASSADLASIRNAALAEGMKPMLISGLEKAARGITSIQEICRVVPHGAEH
jgi:general secretion pathway protein E